MAAAVEATYALTLTVKETQALGLDNASDVPHTHTLGAHAGTLTASTTPAATKNFSDDVALSDGGGTLDLTSLAGPASTTATFSGLKVQLIKLACPIGNSAGITVAKGDSNAYNLFGEDNASSETVEVLPGTAHEMFQNDKLEDVDATHKNVKFTGTGTDTIRVQLVAG